jgi:hypothetical protein
MTFEAVDGANQVSFYWRIRPSRATAATRSPGQPALDSLIPAGFGEPAPAVGWIAVALFHSVSILLAARYCSGRPPNDLRDTGCTASMVHHE